MPCWPSWHPTYVNLSNKVVSSGCATVGGNVQCKPSDMAAKAGVSLEAYTLARYMQSEVGSGTIEERVAVGEAAVNRAKLAKTDILARLLYRQPVGHPNRGWYGPIHGPGGVGTSPYQRWAATSRDPSPQTLALAALVMSGKSGNFSKGADDQNGPQYFPDPTVSVRSKANGGNYWVGPLPGVNHMHTFLYRYYGYKPTSPEGAILLQRGLDAVRSGNASWNIDCVDSGGLMLSGGAIVGLFLAGSAAIAGVIYLGRQAGARASVARSLPRASVRAVE